MPYFYRPSHIIIMQKYNLKFKILFLLWQLKVDGSNIALLREVSWSYSTVWKYVS